MHKTERYMTTTEINYKGTDYTCRIVTSNEGESLIIGGLELFDALMPYPITDKCNGFADKEAERVDEEIFYYTSCITRGGFCSSPHKSRILGKRQSP